MSRSAVQTAELTLKPDPNDSCHRRCPRFTPWRLSTNDQAYLRARARVSAAAHALTCRHDGSALCCADTWQGLSASRPGRQDRGMHHGGHAGTRKQEHSLAGELPRTQSIRRAALFTGGRAGPRSKSIEWQER